MKNGGAHAPVDAIRPIVEQRPWRLAEFLLKQDARHVHRLGSDLIQATPGRGSLVVNAVAALKMALSYLCRKIHGEPLHRLSGSALQDRVAVYSR